MKRRPFSPVPSGTESPAANPSEPLPVRPKKVQFIPPMLLPKIGEAHSIPPRQSGNADDYSEPHTLPEQPGTLTTATAQSADDGSVKGDVAYQAVWIDAFSIDENQHAPRQQYSDSTILDLAASIKEKGQRDAIHVIPNPKKPGRYIVGDGWTRVQAIRAKDLQELKVKAVIHNDLSEVDVAWFGYWQNEERNEHTDFDRATFYNKLREEGWTWDQLSARTGIPVGTLLPYGAYTKADPDILDLAKRYPKKVTVNVVSLLARMNEARGLDATLSLCRSFIENDETIRWLRDRVLVATDHKKTERKSSSVKFQRRYASGMFKQRTDGSIEVSGTIPQNKLEEFNAAMDRLLQPYFGASEAATPTPPANEVNSQ